SNKIPSNAVKLLADFSRFSATNQLTPSKGLYIRPMPFRGNSSGHSTEAIVRTGKLNVKQVKQIVAGRDAEPKRYYGDGGGLWLVVTKRDDTGKPLAASYVFRFMLYGKSREMGLGSAWDILVADAREKARLARARVRIDNADVVEEKRAEKKAKRAAAL